MRWVEDHLAALKAHRPLIPSALNDPAADNWTPLFAFAELAGHEWAARARESAVIFSIEDADNLSLSEVLICDFRDLLETADRGRLRTIDALTALERMENRPWGAHHGPGRPFNAHDLGKMLRVYGIRSTKIRFPAGSFWGYEADATTLEILNRYAPRIVDQPEQPEHFQTRVADVPDVPVVPDIGHTPESSHPTPGTINLRTGRVNP